MSIVWLHAWLFWLSLHVYLVPLQVHLAAPRVFDLYRRTALLVLGHPWYAFVVLFGLLAISRASVVVVPVSVLIGPAHISLVQAQALGEMRRRHGDLAETLGDEVSRR